MKCPMGEKNTHTHTNTQNKQTNKKLHFHSHAGIFKSRMMHLTNL